MTEPLPDIERFATAQKPLSAGRYEVKLARTSHEIRLAQQLRYQVMYAEKGGKPDLQKIKEKADVDEWDPQAFHIIVTDKNADELKVVGTLRLVSNLCLNEGQSFYTEHAFDVTGLRNHYGSMLELGRFCIDPEGRNGVILMLIWKYAMEFISTNQVEVMFGCASFPGTNIAQHRDVLTYLYDHNLATEALMPQPKIEHIKIRDIRLPDASFEQATRDIPTLLRGYLKLGARTSECAVVDPVFNTTFICIYVDARSMMSENTTLVTSRS